MGRISAGRIAGALLVWLSAALSPAWADAIDGNWCDAQRRHMSIRGSEIVTPGGTRMLGSYSRHSFSYVVPPVEVQAGRTVYMVLVNEDTIHLRFDNAPTTAGQAAVQVWHRCSPPVISFTPATSIGGRRS